MAEALATLAREDATDLREVIDELRRRDSYTANRLLLALYGGGAARHADEVVSLLCDEPWRFECELSGSPHWCAMETIRAVIPYCTTGNRKRLESVILSYVSHYERTGAGSKRNGQARFALLSTIPTELRSARANAHFQELERKFGEPEGEPHEFVMREVVSPGDPITTFCDSRAYQDDSFRILHTLEKSQGWLPGTTCMVCEKFLDRFAGEARDIRTRHAGDAHTIVKLIFRTYQQHQQDERTVRSLDLIDRLCLEGIGAAGGELEQFER